MGLQWFTTPHVTGGHPVSDIIENIFNIKLDVQGFSWLD